MASLEARVCMCVHAIHSHKQCARHPPVLKGSSQGKFPKEGRNAFVHPPTQGAAMGAQETLTNSLHIFIAIVSHKGLAAYALGSSIVDSQVRYSGSVRGMGKCGQGCANCTCRQQNCVVLCKGVRKGDQAGTNTAQSRGFPSSALRLRWAVTALWPYPSAPAQTSLCAPLAGWCSMQQFWSVVLPFTFASPVGIFVGYIISDLATGVGAAAISALASGEVATGVVACSCSSSLSCIACWGRFFKSGASGLREGTGGWCGRMKCRWDDPGVCVGMWAGYRIH
jgi:hypothetical protein